MSTSWSTTDKILLGVIIVCSLLVLVFGVLIYQEATKEEEAGDDPEIGVDDNRPARKERKDPKETPAGGGATMGPASMGSFRPSAPAAPVVPPPPPVANAAPAFALPPPPVANATAAFVLPPPPVAAPATVPTAKNEPPAVIGMGSIPKSASTPASAPSRASAPASSGTKRNAKSSGSKGTGKKKSN